MNAAYDTDNLGELIAGMGIPDELVVAGVVRVVMCIDGDGNDIPVAKFDGDLNRYAAIGLLEWAKASFVPVCNEDDDDS